MASDVFYVNVVYSTPKFPPDPSLIYVMFIVPSGLVSIIGKFNLDLSIVPACIMLLTINPSATASLVIPLGVRIVAPSSFLRIKLGF